MQPLVAGFASVDTALVDAARLLGAGPVRLVTSILVPLARRSLLAAIVLSFLHTIGEFGVVLMLGGDIPGATRTLSIVLYNQVENFNYAAANRTAAILLGMSVIALALIYSKHKTAWAQTGADAVLEFSLHARRGSFHLQVECTFASDWTVVFGPSGSGKSTLLRLLAGLDRPTRGRIALDQRALTDTAVGLHLPAGHRRTALVAQQPALFPHLSVAANVAYGLRSLDRATRAARVEEMLALAGATDLAARRPQDLSGGEAQRVALARALAPAPRLLLLDEPFSALDGVASDALLERLQLWLKENQVQAVMATHDVTDALATSAEVLLLREGRLTALGPAAQVLAAEARAHRDCD